MPNERAAPLPPESHHRHQTPVLDVTLAPVAVGINLAGWAIIGLTTYLVLNLLGGVRG